MQKNRQGTMFVTASKDKTAKLFDVDDLSVHKVYVTERPVNSASLSPIYDHVSKINVFCNVRFKILYKCIGIF